MTTPAWTVPPTWSLGNVPVAADFNNLMRDNMLHLGTPPSVQVFTTAVQSAATGVLTVVTFANEAWKTDATMHNNVTNNSRLVCATGLPGFYRLTANLVFAPNAVAGVRTINYKFNGVDQGSFVMIPNIGSINVGLYGGITVPMVAGDYVEIGGVQDSGGALNMMAGVRATLTKISN